MKLNQYGYWTHVRVWLNSQSTFYQDYWYQGHQSPEALEKLLGSTVYVNLYYFKNGERDLPPLD